MVKPNLPVGAVFEDGGLYFEVQSVLPDGNYISKRIEKREPLKEEAPGKSEDEYPENIPEETIPDKPEEKIPVAASAEKKVTRNVQRKTTRGRKK
mgnify:CR=1 FL=1